MHKWILRCLDFKKTIFIIAAIVLIASSLGLRYLKFDFKLDVMKEGQFTQQIAFITVYDKQLLDSEHLTKLAQMQNQLASIKLVEKITSLYTVPNLRRYLDENQWHSVLEDKLYENEALSVVKSDVLDNELFIGKFINKKADTMLFYVYLPTDKYGEVELQARKQIQSVLDQYHSSFTRIFQSGTPEMIYVFAEKTKLDLLLCIPMLVILLSTLFGWLFRSISVALFPIGLSAYGIICGLGTMGWIGIPVSPLFMVAIVLTLAITVASSAHIIYAYQESANHFTASHIRDKFSFVLKKILLPLLLASGAALLGFMLDILSFVPVIENLSYAFGLCIFFTTLAIIFLSPLLLSIINIRPSKDRKVFNGLMDIFVKINEFLVRCPYKVITVLLLVSFFGAYYAKNMTIESLPYVFFKKSDPFIKNIYFSGRQVSGQNALQINITSKEKNIFLNPEYLQKILDIEKNLSKLPGTSYTYSAADVIATTNQIFLFNAKGFFRIPKDPRILAKFYQELSGQGFMLSLINKDYNSLTLYINCNIYSAKLLGEYKEKVDHILKEALIGSPLCFEVKDFWTEFARIVGNLLILQIASIFTIYLVCFIIVGMLFRSVIAGLISVIPNIIPLCIIAVVQCLLGIPISVMSVILYSIVVGLSIDETIHIFYTFKEEYLKLGDKHLASMAALKSQVMPVTISSFSIGLACLALLSSQYLPVAQLGFLVGVGIFSTWIADLLITPFLLRKVNIIKRFSILKNCKNKSA